MGKVILLTGGHAATTGIAVVEEIRRTEALKNSEIYWIGSKTAIEGSKTQTLESIVFPKIGVHFEPIIAGKLQTKFTPHTIPSLLKIPMGFIQAFFLILKIRPNVTLSFGGYSSFPVVFWSWVFRIPVILHEQTVVAGRATLASAKFASKITLAREESLKYFPKGKSVVTGNPVMSSILSVKPLAIHHSPFTILVMGGSRGSNFINELIKEILPQLLKGFKIIHITGEMDFENVKKLHLSVIDRLKGRYQVLQSVDPLEMSKYYEEADFIISRAGANSVSEIIYVRRPAILIPLPRTFMDEQTKNAKYAETFGGVITLQEKEATPERMLVEIKRLNKKIDGRTSPDLDASKKIVGIIQEYI